MISDYSRRKFDEITFSLRCPFVPGENRRTTKLGGKVD